MQAARLGTVSMQGKPLEDSSEAKARKALGSNDDAVGHGKSPSLDAVPSVSQGKAGSQDDYDARWPSWKEDPDDVQYAPPVQLSAAELESLSRAAVRGLLSAVATQVAVSIAVAVVAFAVSGGAAGVSALVGAAAYAIPNALFAFRLILSVHKPGGANPVTFFLGEFFKIAFAGLLIFVAASLGREMLVWPAFLVGLVCALKSQWLALAFGRKQK